MAALRLENTVSNCFEKSGISKDFLEGIDNFRTKYPVPSHLSPRISQPKYHYIGKDVIENAVAAILCGENILLSGPKATGKNVLAQNLSEAFGRPEWDISFHIDMDASYLIGTDTYDGDKVVFRPGPIYESAINGGFAVMDEINMARNEALAVLHSTLDYRKTIDVPGYDRITVSPSARFIGTMNYGYAGTRDLNEALSSRFVIINMPVLSPDDLTQLILDDFPSIKMSAAKQFSLLFDDIRKKCDSSEISTKALDLRGLLDAIRLIQTGIPADRTLEMCIVNKTFDEYERGLVRDVINSRIGHKMSYSQVFGE